MTSVHARATFAFGGWDVAIVVIASELDGVMTRGLIFHIRQGIDVDPRDLWAAIVNRAQPSDIALPFSPAAPPTSPSRGVHVWRWGAAG